MLIDSSELLEFKKQDCVTLTNNYQLISHVSQFQPKKDKQKA